MEPAHSADIATDLADLTSVDLYQVAGIDQTALARTLQAIHNEADDANDTLAAFNSSM